MEIIDDLNELKWTKAEEDDVAPECKSFTIFRKTMVKPGSFKYFVREFDNEDADTISVTLEDAKGKRDPLGAVRNCEFTIDEDHRITAINVDGDCVQRKS